jgi:hypothetical protein
MLEEITNKVVKLKFHTEYPCGYKVDLEINSTAGFHFSEDKYRLCPIHGSKCIRIGDIPKKTK